MLVGKCRLLKLLCNRLSIINWRNDHNHTVFVFNVLVFSLKNTLLIIITMVVNYCSPFTVSTLSEWTCSRESTTTSNFDEIILNIGLNKDVQCTSYTQCIKWNVILSCNVVKQTKKNFVWPTTYNAYLCSKVK